MIKLSKLNKINVFFLEVTFILASFLLFNQAQCLSSIPFTQTATAQYIQANTVTLVNTGSKSGAFFVFAFAINYNKVKASSNLISFSYGSMNYNLNLLYTANSSYLLSANLYLSMTGSTGFTPHGQISFPSQINSIQYSYLVVDSRFPYYSSIQRPLCVTTSAASTYNYNYKQPNPIVVPFSWGLYIEVKGASLLPTQQFQVLWTPTILPSSIQFRLSSVTVGFYSYAVKLQLFVIYDTDIPSTLYQFTYLRIETSNSISSVVNCPSYVQGVSILMYGLVSFDTIATGGSLAQSLVMNLAPSTGSFQLTNSASVKNAVYSVLVINDQFCSNARYPYLRLNTISGLNQCFDSCFDDQYFYYDTVSNIGQCQKCASPCIQCQNQTFCLSCIDKMSVNQDGTCSLLNEYFNNSGTIQYCYNGISNCLTCLDDGSECTSCEQLYFLSSDGLTCTSCQTQFDVNCESCTVDYCLECKTGYVLKTGSQCVIPSPAPTPAPIVAPTVCKHANCRICNTANLAFCTTCVDIQILPVNGRCVAQCGDGKIMSSQQCDDQNLQSLDGCSSTCMIQDGFQCDQALFLPTSKYFKSTCFYAKAITFDLIRILKVKNENKIQIQIRTPNVKVSSWTQIDFSKIFTFSGEAAQFIVSASYQSSQNKNQKIQARRLLQNEDNQQYVTVTVEYNASMQNKELLLSIDPAVSSLVTFSKVSAFSSSFTVKSDDNEKVNFYSKDTYESANLILHLAQILGIATFAMIVLGLFVGNMMVPLDLCGVIQLSYFSLLNVGQLNPLFLALSGLKFSSGFNPSLSYSSPLEDPADVKQIVGISMYSTMIDNFNISLAFVIVFLLVGAVLKLVAKFLLKAQGTVDNVNKISSNLIGSSTFYLIVCFSYLMSVSIGICIKSGSSGIINIILIAICLILMIAYAVFLIKYEKAQYFEKINQKVADFRRLYLVSGLGFRVLVGFSIVLLMDSKIGGVIVCILCLLWIVVLIAKARPYKLTHMIRLISTLVLGLCVQIICCYQRFSADASEQQANLSLYSPVSVLVILYLAFFINLMFFVYSIKQIRCCSLQIEWQKVKKSSFSKINNSEEYNLLKDAEVKSQKQQKQKSQKNACLVQLSNLEINQNQNQLNPSAKKYETYEDKSKGQKQQLTLIISSCIQQAAESPKNRQLLNRQIKKQLKDYQISKFEGSSNKLMKPCQKQQNLSFNGSSYQSDVNIYKTLKKQNFKQGSALESGQSTPKYKHALPNKFCTFEQI